MTEKVYNDFTDLDIWKLAHEIRKAVYALTAKLPTEEKFNLISQSRSSSCSTCANIAEGHGRFHFQENIQFCRQARGSNDETRDHLIAIGAIYQNLKGEATCIIVKCMNLKPKINGYIAYLKKCKKE